MMDEIMRQEERILLNQIAKLTEEGHLAWDCVEYNPIGCYEMTLVKGKIACQKQIFEQGHVRRAETIRIPALATLLYVDWLPQVNGPPGALLSSVVDHESAIIVNT